MIGTLYVIGVGPGDPELLTLKAVRILRKTPCICVPKGREEGSSLALSIVKKVVSVEDKEVIESYFPMRKTKIMAGVQKAGRTDRLCELDIKWQETIEVILGRLSKGMDVAFLTMGDPTIYSTFFYLHGRLLELAPELNIEIVPGISSINASAASAKLSLGLADEKIAILPATYVDNLRETLERFETVVLMKVHSVFGDVLKTLNEMNLLDSAIYISKAGMEGEEIFKDIRYIKEKNLNYFSVVIVRK